MAADEQPAGVGSVAHEAARLAEAFAAWTADAAEETSRAAAGDGAPAAASASAGRQRDAPGTDAPPGATGDRDRVCPECGAARGGTTSGGPAAGHDTGAGSEVPPTCRICPVCQGLALLRSVRPETVDRLADLVGAVADSLRAWADTRRDADTGPREDGEDPRGQTQDIPVTGDELDDETDEGGRA